VVVVVPGHNRPLLKPGMALRLELDGYRHAYQALEIERVAHEAVGPAEARRILGAEIGDAVPVASSVVFAWARLPESGVFHSAGRAYPYHEGLRGRAEVKVRSQRLITALVPGLENLAGETS
jgi:membrane fusion protein (multidrug efflux system)